MAFSADNPVVGGTSLARAQIQSPNFITGSTGWVIRQDGSAEFNNVVIRGGVVVGGTALYYSGTPAFGNLIASIAGTGGTDTFGNAYLAGVVGYTHVGGNYSAVQSGGSGTVALTGYYTASSAAGPWTLQGFIETVAGEIQVVSNSAIVLSPGGTSGTVGIFTSASLGGGIPVSQINRSAISVGNSAAATDITNVWTIPAHDADNGAKYVLETFVTATTGATTAESLTLGVDIDGGFAFVPLATLGAAFNGAALSTTYGIPVRLIIVPGAGASASDAQITLEASVGDTSANRLATNSANMSGFSNTTAYSTGFTHSVALYAQWGGAGGAGQSAGTNWSEFTRSGQD